MAIFCKDHVKEISDIFCIDLKCKHRRLMCKICQQTYHSQHNSIYVKKFLEYCQSYLQSKIEQHKISIGQIEELLLTYDQPNQSNIFKSQFDVFLNQRNFKLEEILQESNINRSSIINKNIQSENSQKGTNVSQYYQSSDSIKIRDQYHQSQIMISNIIKKLDLSTGYLIELSQAKLQFKSQLLMQSQIAQHVSIVNQQDKSQEYYEKGMQQFIAKNYNQSIELFEKALSIKSNLEQAWIYKILSYGELKQNNIAIQECEKAKKVFKNANNFCFLYGILLQEEKRYLEAFLQFQININNNKEDIESLYQAGISLFELQLYDLAGEYFADIIKIKENHENAYLMQGRIALQKEQIENAILCFNQCNQNSHANFYLAQIYMNLSQFQSAKQNNDKYCSIFKDDIKGKLQKGQILLLNNENKEAIQIFNEIISQYPDLADTVKEIINLHQQR
ncbi:unnamed protein product [Paramecium pentaurelia]|uniref:Tetratricopeptide repeat protein n=1 Tax=Paramecium pentaurelia TaxID=43138 RepID=A0A8S1RYW1_9CILI|nr:unnamed protein product [Paramecium pentaurelia]